MTTIISILTALANIKAIAGYVEDFAKAVVLWYVRNATSATLAAISETAALGARAETQEDRIAVAKKWQETLSRPRVEE